MRALFAWWPTVWLVGAKRSLITPHVSRPYLILLQSLSENFFYGPRIFPGFWMSYKEWTLCMLRRRTLHWISTSLLDDSIYDTPNSSLLRKHTQANTGFLFPFLLSTLNRDIWEALPFVPIRAALMGQSLLPYWSLPWFFETTRGRLSTRWTLHSLLHSFQASAEYYQSFNLILIFAMFRYNRGCQTLHLVGDCPQPPQGWWWINWGQSTHFSCNPMQQPPITLLILPFLLQDSTWHSISSWNLWLWQSLLGC